MKQSTALQIMKEGHNVFLTGEAGSGKSYTLRQFIAYLKANDKRVAVTASTGIAATILGGSTIHSYAQIGIKDTITATDIYNIRRKPPIVEKLRNVDVLIIDEISMLHGRQLDMVNYVFKCIRNDFRAFGGLQLIVAGDFFQLPPVGSESASERFAFMSEAWKEAEFKICYLTEQHRQSDNNLNKILNAIRNDCVEEHHEELLMSTFENELSSMPTKLYTHNANVDYENNAQLAALPDPGKIYKAVTEGKPNDVRFLESNVLSPPLLKLKIGAKVMFTKNHPEGLYVNGTMGVVTKLGPAPTVTTDEGDILASHQSWEKINDFGDTVAKYTQIPLRLAWAITVHKCVDPSTYVATDKGLQQIKDIAHEGKILTKDYTFEAYKDFVQNPILPSRTLSCDYGYFFSGTKEHKCLVFRKNTWVYLETKEITVGDWMQISISTALPWHSYLTECKGTIIDLKQLNLLDQYSVLAAYFLEHDQLIADFDTLVLVQQLLLRMGRVSCIKDKSSLSLVNLDETKVPVDDEVVLRSSLEETNPLCNYLYVQVVNVEDTLAESMCVSVPGVGNFIQNGFVGSNCQGLTLQEAEVDLSNTFEWGQGYVALSRLRDIESLKVLGMNEKTLKLSPLARKADARFKQLSQEVAEAYGEVEE